MENTLSKPIIFHEIYFFDGTKEVVWVTQDVDFVELMRNKSIVKVQNIVINFASVSRVKEKTRDKSETATAWASSLSSWLREVALARLQKYKDQQWHNMQLDKLQKWIEAFVADMWSFEKYKKIYEKYKNI
jgi:hypothetical protein